MSLQEISEFAAAAKTDKEKRQALAERHRRFAFPFACLTLTAMTFILAIQGKRFSTRPRTVIVVLFMAMGFYLLLVMGHNLSVSGTVPVWLGVWFSNIVYGAIILKSLASSRPLWSGLTSLINFLSLLGPSAIKIRLPAPFREPTERAKTVPRRSSHISQPDQLPFDKRNR